MSAGELCFHINGRQRSSATALHRMRRDAPKRWLHVSPLSLFFFLSSFFISVVFHSLETPNYIERRNRQGSSSFFPCR